MRIALIGVALAALSLYGAEPKPQGGEAAPAQRDFTESEITKLQLIETRIESLNKDYKIAEYQQKLQEITAPEQLLITEACKSIGIAAEKVKDECGVSLGVDKDGKQLMGADGKPLASRVWRKPPQAPVVPGTK